VRRLQCSPACRLLERQRRLCRIRLRGRQDLSIDIASPRGIGCGDGAAAIRVTGKFDRQAQAARRSLVLCARRGARTRGARLGCGPAADRRRQPNVRSTRVAYSRVADPRVADCSYDANSRSAGTCAEGSGNRRMAEGLRRVHGRAGQRRGAIERSRGCQQSEVSWPAARWHDRLRELRKPHTRLSVYFQRRVCVRIRSPALRFQG